MKVKLFALALIAFALSINEVDAQTIKKTTKSERKRIKQGVKTGELTKAEAKNLINDQKEIKEEIKEAKADGTVTKEERKEIKQDQKKASRKIYRKKHNNRDSR